MPCISYNAWTHGRIYEGAGHVLPQTSPGIANFSSCAIAKSWKVMKVRIERLVPSFFFPFNNSYNLYQFTWQGKMENGTWSLPLPLPSHWIPGSAPVITQLRQIIFLSLSFFINAQKSQISGTASEGKTLGLIWGPSPCGEFWLKPWIIWPLKLRQQSKV